MPKEILDVYESVDYDYLSQDRKEEVMAKSYKYKNDLKTEEDFEKNVERLKKWKLKDAILDEPDDDWDEDRMDIIGSNGNIGYELEDQWEVSPKPLPP